MRLFAVVLLLASCTLVSAVEYRITLESIWSESTHPDAFAGVASHFSSPILGTHSSDISIWELGGIASVGVESMAEVGGTSALKAEFDAGLVAGTVSDSAVGRFMNLPATQEFQFDFTDTHPLFTFASMIGPSPDWFVGVSSLNLKSNGSWVDRLSVELFPVDAGTEEGDTFSMLNPASNPQQPITALATDDNSVFSELPPFATLTFERQLVCDFNEDGLCNVNDLSTVDGLYSVGDLQLGVAVTDNTAKFDLTGDGVADSADLDQFLKDTATVNGFAEPYLRGDTNLNDHIAFGDFTLFSRNFGTGREWGEGNYRGSGVSSFEDFLFLSRNFGKSIARISSTPEATSVPEPTSIQFCLIAGIFLLLTRRRCD